MNEIILKATIEAMKEWRDTYSRYAQSILKPASKSPYDDPDYTNSNDYQENSLIDFIIYALTLDKMNEQRVLFDILQYTATKLFSDQNLQSKFKDKLDLVNKLLNQAHQAQQTEKK
ncbi:hypothetical protein [Campylobacter sp.]|uniref:hypothetical protein n=1 Tax=Campylobacter sp. TaxID=205 RepID=UPI002AA62DEA|nr:hypothetical protein [Campylobacter sp.]MCI7447361.1 hypothetical protein [Campylobacter sp.]